MANTRTARARPSQDPPSWWKGALLLLFIASLAWKLYCLNRLVHSPLFGEITGDSWSYWVWAQMLVHGDWIGHNPFFLAPLYPYLLALLRPAGAYSYAIPLLAQCVLGAFAGVLVAESARVLCPPKYAISAGVLTAGYAMATFMDLSLLSESVLWFLAATFVYVQLVGTRREPSLAHPVISGLLIGLMSLGRPSFALLLGPHLVSAGSGRGIRRAIGSAAIALACAVGVWLPVLVRHISLGHGWIFTTYSLGYNAYVGNGPGATGAYVSRIDGARDDETSTSALEGGVAGDGRAYIRRKAGLELSPQGSSAYWLREMWAHVRTAPVRSLRLLVWKSALSLNHVEASQLDNIHVHERIEGPMGLPWLGEFGIIGVLGLFGLFVIRRTAAGHVLLAHALAAWTPLVIFFVTDRYRYHLALPLLIASGPAIEALLHAVRSSRGLGMRIAPALAPLAAAALVVWLPLVHFDRQQVEFESHRALGDALLKRGRQVEGELELAACVAPGTLSRLPLRESTAARAAVAGALHSLASSYAERGAYEQSEEALRLALSYAPEVRDLRRDHAVVLAMNGMQGEALAELDTLGAAVTLLERDLLRVAENLVRKQAWDPAERALRAAIEADSTSEAANVILLRLLRAQGRRQEADALRARLPGRGVPAERTR